MDVGVISRVDSEWCSPVVLVIKTRWSLESMRRSNTVEQEYSPHGVGRPKSQRGGTRKIEGNEVHVQI